MQRAAFEHLVRETAYRPAGPDGVRAELDRQAQFYPTPISDGLAELAPAVFDALAGRLDRADAALAALCRKYPSQPLGHFYQCAVRYHRGDRKGAIMSLERHMPLDPDDPIVEMLRRHFQGQTIPGITDETRLANIRKAAATPLLKNPYMLAVGAIFETIKDREHARVMDVGVGSGAQMMELLGLIRNRPNRLKRLDLVGLDFVEGFLETAGRNISNSAEELAGRVAVSFRPVRGHVEDLGETALREIAAGGGLQAVNATITLHEVPGELKATALQNLRRLNPEMIVIVEWNHFMENVLPESSVEFLFNVRKVAGEWVAALRDYYAFEEARAVVRDVLTQAGGQVTSPAAKRQECYLNITCWYALAQACGFDVVAPSPDVLQYAFRADMAGMGEGSWYVAAYQQGGATPIAMMQVVPR